MAVVWVITDSLRNISVPCRWEEKAAVLQVVTEVSRKGMTETQPCRIRRRKAPTSAVNDDACGLKGRAAGEFIFSRTTLGGSEWE